MITKSNLLLCSASAVALCSVSSATLAQGSTAFDLGSIILGWDNLDRPVRETSAANTVVDGERIERADNDNVLEALDGLPNIDVERGNLLPSIRGLDGTGGAIGAKQFATGANPRVNVVVDGVSRISSTNGALGALTSGWDVERVEVARGPQTTTGGRSSLAGAINVISNNPVFEEEIAVRFSFETRNEKPLFGISGLYNTPLSDDVAVRFSFDGDYGDEFINVSDPLFPRVSANREEIENIRNGTFRAKLLYAPQAMPELEVLLSYEHETQDGLGTTSRDVGGTNFDFSSFTNANSEAQSDQNIFALRVRYEVSPSWTFQGQLSYQELQTRIPPTNAFFDLTQNFENTQLELTANYSGDGFVRGAVIGFAYEDQKENGTNDTLFGGLPFVFIADGDVTNTSVFGEVEFALGRDVFAFVGGRYEEQEIRRDVDLTFFGVSQSQGQANTDTEFTPRIGIRYEASDALVLGYQYSEGYRPGGVDVDLQPPVAGTNTFEGETLRQHEVWARYTDPAGRFNLDGAVFFYQLDDAQVLGAGGGRLIANLPEAEGYGLELSGDVQLTSNSRLFASVGFVETEITDVGAAPNGAAFLGKSLPESVGQTYSIGYQYRSPRGWDFAVQAKHVADRAGFVATIPVGPAPPNPPPTLPDYTQVDLRAGIDWDLGPRQLRVEGFIENVFDQRIILTTDPGLAVFNAENVAAPRTFGISATMRF